MNKLKIVLLLLLIILISVFVYYEIFMNKNVLEEYNSISFKYKSEEEQNRIKKEIARTYEENYIKERAEAEKRSKNREQENRNRFEKVEKKVSDIERLKERYLKAQASEKKQILGLFARYIGNEDYVIMVLDELEEKEQNIEIKELIQARLINFYKTNLESIEEGRMANDEWDYNTWRNRYIEFTKGIDG